MVLPMAGGLTWSAGAQETPEVADELVIDVSGGPDNLDPALTRSIRDWSVLHSIYDSILDLSDDGDLVPLAADSFTIVDELTFEVVLRIGLTFHDGTPVTVEAIERSIVHVQESDGPAAGNFGAIVEVETVDERTVRLKTAEPAPWLPSQLAVWMVLFPEGVTAESFEQAPIGTGPYRFVSREAGSEIVLERNPDYPADSPKGTALAEQIRYRFVPESTTRVADLATGVAQIIDAIPQDQIGAIEDGGGQAIEAPVLGTSFLRMVNDVAPFDDPLVRQAINHAIDVETIGAALISTGVNRLASLFPDERSIGFDPELAPFAYDPERARELLAEAGYEDGFETTFQYTGGGRDDVMQAIAANLEEVGIRVTIEVTELAAFNGSWTDPESAALRYVTWRPVYDPHTLLSLMFASTGPLSRFADDEADALIAAAAVESEPEARAGLYRDLGRYFQETPPAVFLWNLTANYGVAGAGLEWQPRGDEYLIATTRKGNS
jgi:peptide/nickel transport system substrate-binding protein